MSIVHDKMSLIHFIPRYLLIIRGLVITHPFGARPALPVKALYSLAYLSLVSLIFNTSLVRPFIYVKAATLVLVCLASMSLAGIGQ